METTSHLGAAARLVKKLGMKASVAVRTLPYRLNSRTRPYTDPKKMGSVVQSLGFQATLDRFLAVSRSTVDFRSTVIEEYGKPRSSSEDVRIAMPVVAAAAKGGNRAAQLAFGMMNVMGVGMAKNVDAGLIWLQKAANNGSRQALGLAAAIHECGTGVPVNVELAKICYDQAAAMGCKMSQGRKETLERDAALPPIQKAAVSGNTPLLQS